MPVWMKWAIALLVGGIIITLGWRLLDSRFFFWVLPSFFVVNCLVLVIVVLLQSGKAADLAGAFGGAGSQTAFGPRGAANVLSKATTWCAIMFMLCAMALVLHTDRGVEQSGSVLQKVSKPASKPAPVTPVVPEPSTHNSLPASSQPVPGPSQPSQPAPGPTKKP
jgi:preprotein translocase subunit SecG